MSKPDLAREIKVLREELAQMQARGISLDHPDMLFLSRVIDGLVLAFYRQMSTDGQPHSATPAVTKYWPDPPAASSKPG